MKWGAEDDEERIIITRAINLRETQERSRGQVLAGNKHDIKPVLDAVIISACKGYVWMWCKDHSKTVPDDTSFNKAVTLQIDYSRK
ncbi:hypothetical protein DPMN_028362 [Dreissena polymorpha]|uniref:Uncharacterized protein n=1 Tax=Dreissena polymorpha TaxID=45954 RepID=A0A9D4LX43_DREPO|nr:hypothetical protein DPMN_028362 [Dreissena polymorpha]